MRDGFIKVAASTPEIRVADVDHNKKLICEGVDQAWKEGVQLLVYPELCLTGYTCGDLFWQEELLEKARQGLSEIVMHSLGKKMLIFVGLPWEMNGKLYNVAAAVSDGELLGLVPKRYLPAYSEFYEERNFTPGKEEITRVMVDGKEIPFGSRILFSCPEVRGLSVAAELCEDLWTPEPPSIGHAMAGATVIVNLSASDETTGKSIYRRNLISGQSARLLCGYIYASAGEGESTTDLVFGGHNVISENGVILAESRLFENSTIVTELDIQRLRADRRKQTTFSVKGKETYEEVLFHLEEKETGLTRFVDPAPFVPSDEHQMEQRCEEIFHIQAMGLKKRLKHTGCRNVTVGISGGLDSTLALLVTAKAFDLLGIDRSSITAVTMPCFGTTDRTYQNACELTRRLGASLKEVDIKKAVRQHFEDIGHSEE